MTLQGIVNATLASSLGGQAGWTHILKTLTLPGFEAGRGKWSNGPYKTGRIIYKEKQMQDKMAHSRKRK